MEVIILLIVQFLAGVIIGGCYVWSVHKRHREAWHDEYRRLMGGIMKTRTIIKMRHESQHPSSQNHDILSKSSVLLKRLYDGETL